ncbi:recombinase family protein [Photobacterium sanguinicancri]|uniref:Transposase n=1 Tax=Photobacterium sanguinicancri TaxID=875932 RepID=A0ABX4FVZ9_9GAMM|nr:recombinase family protein [Photobacterium sanguinicancri]OZS43038.1 transposase [Photobacterium sanguinicancri]
MASQKIGYIRVSSSDQNPERQLADIDLDKVFTERRSGKSRGDRPVLQECLEYIREADELHIHSIDRLARNIIDLQGLVDEVTEKGASIHFHTENLKFDGSDDPFSELSLHLLGAFASFERKLINIRQREGMDAAKRAGKHVGRPPTMTPKMRQIVCERASQGDLQMAIAKDLNISRQSVYRVLKESKDALKAGKS